jgi:hypothetical protein
MKMKMLIERPEKGCQQTQRVSLPDCGAQRGCGYRGKAARREEEVRRVVRRGEVEVKEQEL